VTIRVIHIVESVIPNAGTISVCLPGLLESLRPLGIDGLMVDTIQQWETESASSQIVQIHGWGFPLGLHAARAAKRAGKPYVLSPLGTLTPGDFNRQTFVDRLRKLFAERPLVRGAAALIALNDVDGQALRVARTNSNIVMLPYGLKFDDIDQASAMATPSKTHRTILMLGPIDPMLGCVVLLKAFAELALADDGWTVTLAGQDRGHWRGQLEAAVRRKGGEGRVVFEEAKSLRDQMSLLNEAHLLAAPSLHVSSAVSIMQAIAAGVPVIATRNAAPLGLDGEIHICGSSRADVREALRSVLEVEPGRREELAKRGREKARGLFDWSVLAPRYAELYQCCTRN
jgi:glycosyltransferase involved in cell wall biosynthesis